MADEKDWKARYLKEAREWDVSDQLLRKVLGRLALAAEGNSSDLDKVLERIQRHARDRDDKGLAASLNDLSAQIRILDNARAEAPAVAVEAPPENTATGIKDVLLALIDEVAVTQPDPGSLDTLREGLQRDGGKNWYRVLDRVMGEVRGLIQRISNDKQALEQLMLEMSAELGDITQVLLDDRSGLDASREQSQTLNDIMTSGVESIQAHIEKETDIAALKTALHQSLEVIRDGIADFVENDAQRLAASEARNADLQQRVEKMERESADLRDSLNENRAKLLRDTLTGAGSRLAYDEALAKELIRFKRYGEVFTLVVLDIDHFKRVNDTYGHTAGDKALTLVARLVGEAIRESDSLFRIGGEEFAVMLPKTDPANAKPLVERVRAAVGDSGFHYDDQPVPMTISAGLTAVRAEDDSETLFARADDALYRAKKGGRNRLVSLD